MRTTRHIICRFDSGPAFLTSLNRPIFGEPTLTFLADFPMRKGQLVRVRILIKDGDERHDLHLRVQRLAPVLDSERRRTCFRYEATPTAEDAPWIEMLAQKYTTARRISA